ncbi:MAG: 5-amino-6-(D-ribitylamino)uracil--L-tyrosine 4-hydroxyphenyl transferase CofH [Methanomicrobiales archaeon]|nr:5-amino-6-(D-ribitylamino)uracil--L-tyrosine 4-hydroxyphenyl transferase CofH [Methanomicrobiales archaeon]
MRCEGRVLGDLLSDAEAGSRLSEEDCRALFSVQGQDLWRVARVADARRARVVGEEVTFVRNQNLNVTNVCRNACGFCGFSRGRDDPESFRLGEAEIKSRAAVAKSRGVTEICTVSGLHPDFTLSSYLEIYSWIREAAPRVHIHAANPMEVAYAASQSGVSTEDALIAMKGAGLGSLCGTAAEILDDAVRQKICPGKVRTDEWVRIIREAHALGIPSTATIMYGHCEGLAEWAAHLRILRDIQDETGGFTEFVPLSFIHHNTRLFRDGQARAGATGREDLLMVAVARLFLDNIRNIQVSWVKVGVKMAQLLLAAGGNDLGGTLYEERISKSAGASDTDYLAPEEMARIVGDLGRPIKERTTLFAAV